MPRTVDDLLKAGVSFGGGTFAAPDQPKDRNLAAVANDTVIEAANAVAGWGKAAGDFIAPGNFVSQGIGRFIEEGEASQSDVAQAAKQTLRSDIEQADGIGGELAAVGRYVVRNPLLTAAQAVGSFVGPGAAIKGAQLAARGLGFGAKGVTRAGVAGGVAAGAAGGGGDAAGNAYELVMQTPLETLMQNPQAQALAQQGADEAQIRDALATEAARSASVIPALIGGAGGAFGAERLLAGGARTAGAKGFAKAVGSEALQEGVEEGATQFEAQRAAAEFNPDVEPTKGVAAAAGMGAVMGGVMGGGVQAVTGDNLRATQTVPEVGVLSAAANAGTEARAQALDAAPPVAASEPEPPMVDPIVERIKRMSGPDRLDAMHAYAIVQRDDVPKGVRQYNSRLLDKLLDAQDEKPAATPKDGAELLQSQPTDPLQGALAQRRDEETSQQNLDNWMARATPLPLDRAQAMKAQAQAMDLSMEVVPHSAGQGYTLVPTEWLAPTMRGEVPQDVDTGLLPMDTAPTGVIRADAAGNASPETGAQRINSVAVQRRLDAQARRKANMGLTPDVERAVKSRNGDASLPIPNPVGQPAGASAPGRDTRATGRSDSLPVASGSAADARARAGVPGGGQAAAQLDAPARVAPHAGTEPGDILTASGAPFKSRLPATNAAKKAGAGYSVVEVPGGFVARKEWREFTPETGTKGIPRADMPQVEGQHHGALTNFLNARGVTHETVEVDPASLKPTQAEYSEAKVEQQAESDSQRGILISSDGHVIDGHHKWLAAGSEGQPVKAIRLNAPVADLLPLIKEFPSAKTAEDQAPAAEQASSEAAGDLPAVRSGEQPAAVAGGGDGQAGADAAADAEPALTPVDQPFYVVHPKTGERIGVASPKAAADRFKELAARTGAATLDISDAKTGQPAYNLLPDGSFRKIESRDEAQARSERQVAELAKEQPRLPAPESATSGTAAPSLSDSPEKWATKTTEYTKSIAPSAERVGQVADYELVRDTRADWNQGDDGRFLAVDKKGNVVADVFFGRRDDGKLEAAVEVAPAARRQGIASAIYEQIERSRGERLAPAAQQTADARAFWVARQRRASTAPSPAPGKPTAAAKPEAKDKAAPEPEKAPAAQKPFDPGELSIPNRTSTIDADLDRYKAEQAKAQRTEQKGNAIKRRADKARAKELFEQLWPAMKDRMGARFGEKELRSTLDSMVKWEPAKFVALAEKFQGESMESGPDQDAQFKREDQQEDQSLSEVEKILDKDTPPTKDDIAAIMRILDARRGGLSVEKAQEIVDSLTAKWKNGPVVRVVASARDLPIKAPSNVRGIYRPGEVWVVAGSHRDGKDVRRTIGRTLAHEAIAHYGLRDMLDADGWGDLMGKINGAIAAGNKPLTEIQAEVRRLYVDDKGTFNLRPEIEADEIAARVVEQAIDENGEFRPGFGFVKAVYAKIAEFLRSLGIDVTFTNAELQGMLVLAQRNLEVGKRTAGGGEVLVAAARDEEPDQALFARAAVLGAATAKLNETFNAPGKLSWWFKSFGTMYNLAERSPAFKPVFRAAQGFIDDVSLYASQAADLAPKILPKLEHWSDIGKSPISAADNKAIEAPINQGTLLWTRGIDGKPVKVADLEAKAAGMTAQQKAQELIRGGRLDPKVLRMWQGMEVDLYETTIGNKYEREMLRPGIVWNDAELKSMFGLTSEQIKLYREFRSATDKSLDNMAKAEMLRFAGEDGAGLRQAVMEETDLDTAAGLLSDYLRGLAADQPDRADQLTTLASGMQDRADKVTALKAEGYAPLSRFGQYTVDVVVDGERQFFGLYESAREANRAAVALKGEFGAANVAQGTLSQQEFKLFAGITPESLEIFGNMLGLDSTGDEARDKAFQEYLQRTKSNRSAMKRLIHRKGIAGYSQDVGRVLAAFIYSNARQTSAALHMGDLTQSITDIPKTQGELKDAAIALADYIKNPQEEAQAIRGLLFAQYLGGSIASAFVNMTQPISVTFPWLSQFGGAVQSAAQIKRAFADLSKRDAALEPDLVRAMQKYEAVLEPQEIHHLMAQARGSATLKSGDGTKVGDLLARGGNALSKLAMGWGKVFGMAEQINRKSTFIAAYRVGVAQKMADPGAFAFKAVNETQFIYSKANKMRFGRGAVGGTVMTFKSFSVSYIELLHRMYTQGGPEGKRAVLLALAVLFLMGGAGGLPFAEDVEDLVDGALQRLGYNVSMKTAKREFLEGLFGPAGAQFVERGISGLPGVPIDVSGRLGLGNLIPGTGLFQQKTSYARDLGELAGPAGDFAKRIWGAKDQVMAGDIGKAVLQVAPVAVRNAAKGVDMADTGMYRDDKGYKVLDTTMLEAALKAIGFQPAAVAQVQESNMLNQRAKNFYSQTAADIRARWAKGIFEKDPDQIADARAMMERWNRNNPEQRITPNMPAILKRVREMRKTKEQRIADTAPKAMRQAMQRAAAEERARR